ncbi:SIMPL domain-containing protein [Skermania piniformis]|uniref:SIMPL domain-containing protein n=1 Tax=Skermania pinensis TaxID=39122 RepID=A0ABX8SBH5_9ACTN|nr:SIMPL domain-containing protein [Skermania piniformis]QXQ15209.1 SIMPL domain-containing protein [Skermania piniformis]
MPDYPPSARAADRGAVTVRGQGRAAATPDLMQVSFTVETRRPDVALAWADAGRVTDAVLTSLRHSGVAGADLTTTGLSVQAETAWEDRRGQRITGYLATASLSAALSLSAVSHDRTAPPGGPSPAEIIAAAVAAGGNDVRLGGFSSSFRDPGELLVRARDAAWADARARAEQYADLAGRRLGAVLDITEQSGPREPRPMLRAMAAAATPMPIEPGESEIRTDVEVTWALA